MTLFTFAMDPIIRFIASTTCPHDGIIRGYCDDLAITTGNSHFFGGEYHELVPNQRIRFTDTFEDPNLPGTIDVTVELREVSLGTEIRITQEGVPDVIPAEACYVGWQESLILLAKLVEPDIQDG